MSTTRNVCVIAHVDHGKTTFSDSLIASNGIISNRLAGTLRYMDSREDEQDRGITMKSSSISLSFQPSSTEPTTEDASAPPPIPVNLIDSPGHVDFGSEVSAAVRLSDCALVLVDAVEGVCVQTHAVLRQAWHERVKPMLVLNKIDRLIAELQLSPLEAWEHIKKIVQEVNAIGGHLFAGAVMEADAAGAPAASRPGRDGQAHGDPCEAAEVQSLEQLQEAVGSREMQFAPEKGNVLFASAIHGWAFDLRVFAQLFARKLGVREPLLQQTLWGEYFFQPKTKKILRTNPEGKLTPMFVQFVLQTLWQVYDAVLLSPDAVKRDKIISSLGLHVPPRELKNADPSVQLRAIMGQWLPLGRNVLRAVVEVMPSADTAQRMRLELLCPEMLAVPAVAPEGALEGAPAGASLSGTAAVHGSSSSSCDDSVADQRQQPGACGAAIAASSDGVEDGGRQDDFERALGRLRAGVEGCSTTAPVVVYIAKMVWVSGVAGAHPDDAFIGFARVFSGTVRPGSGGFLHVLHAQPCADRAHPAAVVQIPVDALRLYVMMGRELQSVSSVTAGTVCGVGGIGSAVLKCGTLSSDPRCPPFARMSMEGAPIVQVAVEPTEVGMLQELERGLALLDQADPSVEVAQLSSGEHVLRTCGEVHLERCLRDLQTTFAPGVTVAVSAPIVPFRESVADERTGEGSASTANKQCTLRVRAQHLPEPVAASVEGHQHSLRASQLRGRSWLRDDELEEPARLALGEVRAALSAAGAEWGGALPLGIAPLSDGANLLLCDNALVTDGGAGGGLTSLLSSLVSGFQLAAGSGPLCEEPLSGVAFTIEELHLEPAAEADSTAAQLSGQLIAATKEACRSAFLACSTRLLEPLYNCELQATQDILGKTYGVLAKRRARIVSEELKEGTPIFTIRALLPVVESFGFAGDLRKQTSGAAHPQLVFSHFEALPQDPMFVVATDEEQEALDDGALPSTNIARKLVDEARRRKGLLVDGDKVVQCATKQRTMARKR